MGVDYRAVLALGQEFDSARECVDFVNHLLTQDERDELEAEGSSFITEIAYGRDDDFPQIQCLNLYSGSGYYVGYDIGCRSVQSFELDFKDAHENWAKNFPDEVAEIIHTVQVS